MMYWALVVASVFCAALAQMCLKRGAIGRHASMWSKYVNPWVVGGYIVLGTTLIVNVFCLEHGIQMKEISAIESLGYLFVPLLSRMFFLERVTIRKMVAIGIIMLGIMVFLL